jgi:hypothetical protein
MPGRFAVASRMGSHCGSEGSVGSLQMPGDFERRIDHQSLAVLTIPRLRLEKPSPSLPAPVGSIPKKP